MKKIKFRIYKGIELIGIERLGKNGWEWMAYSINPDSGERWTPGVFPSLPDYVRAQFTGLKDKNGKEIYEGDIIEHPRQDRPFSSKRKESMVRCIVKWYDGISEGSNRHNASSFNQNPKWIATPLKDKSKEATWGYDWSEFHDCTIIGNIHQKPYLLKS